MAQDESRQLSSIPLAIATGILGVLVLGGQKSSTESTTSTPSNGAKEERTEGSQPIVKSEGPLDPLDDFFALDSGRRHPFSETNRGSAMDYERQLINNYERDYLIVTVPDPADSQFGYVFDELMDSIQRALEMREYVFHRAWLPWELDKRKAVRTKVVTDWRELSAVLFPYRGGKSGEEIDGHRQDNPGTLLFRRTDDKGLRIVFLVGENPTSGIHKRALARAIELIRDHPPSKEPATIRIVGPIFTGSQTSMHMVLHDPCNQCFRFEVISGGAAGVNRQGFARGEGRVNFHATVLPAKLVIRAILHYLAQRERSRSDHADFKPPEEPVVLLTESNTGFGQEMSRDLKKIGSEGARLIELRFPLHIAWLRSRYEETQRSQEDKLNLPALDSLVPRLRSKVPDRDSIPLQDPATTTSANGEVLHDILSLINSQRIRYVGIIATDARDQIMLASAVRDHCPAVQIFLIGSDQLMALPDYNYSLKGTILGSTYPLVAENQNRTDPKYEKKRLLFPSHDVQGYYNAILAQTGGDNQMIGYRPPLLHGPKADGPIPNRPPVWISMIGSNGDLVPLQFFTAPGNDEERDYVWTSQAHTIAYLTILLQSHPVAPILQFNPLAAVACSSYFLTDGAPKSQEKMPLNFPAADALPLIVIAFLCLLVIRCAFLNPTPRLFWTAGRVSQGWHFGEDFFYRTVCLMSLIFLLVPLLGLGWLAITGGQREQSWGFIEITSLGLSVGIMLILALSLLPPVALKNWLTAQKVANVRLRRAVWILYLLLILIISIKIASVWHCSYVSDGLTSWRALFFDRALNLATGVSPLLPLVLLCSLFFFWSFYQLRRSYLADRFSMPCPYPTGPATVGDAFKGIRDVHKKLRIEICGLLGFIEEEWLPAAIVGVIVLIVAVRIHPLCVPTAEGAGWNAIFFLGFVLGFFLIALNLMHFLLLWERLKKLLNEIALVRMMHAFERLPRKVVAVFGGYFLTRRLRVSQLRLPHHQLGLLRAETKRLLSSKFNLHVWPHASKLESIQKLLAGFSERDFDWHKRHKVSGKSVPRDEEEIIKDLSCRFRKVTGPLLELLRELWPQRSFTEAFGSDAVEEKTAKATPVSDSVKTGIEVFQPWMQLAEDFIAMQVVVYLSQFFIQLRNLTWSVIVCGSLLLLAATSYPFQPERLILSLLLTLMGSAIAGILTVLVRINRNELMSRITQTTPNKFTLDWGFVTSFCTYIVPIGTVIALQMTGAFRFLLEPLVRILH